MNGKTMQSLTVKMRAASLSFFLTILAVSVASAQAEILGPDSVTNTISTTDIYTTIGDVELKDTSIGDAIRVLSEMSGLNIVATSAARKEKATLFLKNVSIKDAIDSICRIAGLWYRYNQETGVYVIMTTEEYSKDVVVFSKEYTRTFAMKHHNVASAAQSIEALFGSRVEVTLPKNNGTYELDVSVNGGGGSNRSSSRSFNDNRRGNSRSQNSGAAEELENITSAQLNALNKGDAALEVVDEAQLAQVSQQLKAKIYVTYNDLHNLLFVRSGDEQALDDIAVLVEQVDQPAKQVLLQMKILKVTLGDEQRSIFDYQYSDDKTEELPNAIFANGAINSAGGNFSEEVLGLGNNVLEGGSLVYQVINDRLLARVQLLETEGRVETLATPLLLASGNKAAELFIGEERVLVRGLDREEEQNDDGNVTRVTYIVESEIREIGSQLKIWPRINSNRTVTLDIQQEISSVNKGSTSLPVGINGNPFPIDSLDVSKLDLTAVARDGLSIAVGGMINTSKNKQQEKVPFLGSIPVLGVLFRKDENSTSKSELVLMITPHILNTPDEAERVKQRLAKDIYRAPLIDQHLQQDTVVTPVFSYEMTTDEVKIGNYIVDAWNNLLEESDKGALEAGPQWKPEPDSQFEAQALASWHMGKYYTTMVRLQHTGKGLVNLMPESMGTAWRAVAFEQPTLSSGETVLVCLVSREPFAVALKKNNRLIAGTKNGF